MARFGFYKTLSSGTQVPALAFGTGTALFNQPATEQATLALSVGINHIDAAQMYGNEASLKGPISSVPRSELFITTKLHLLAGARTVKERLQAELRDLGVDYVDLYLVHTPVPWTKKQEGMDLKQVWKGMEECKKLGLAKEIGVSNFRLKDFDAIWEEAEIKPIVNQIEFHPYVYESIQPLLEFHKKHNIFTESFGGQSAAFRLPDGPVSALIPAIQERLKKESGKEVSANAVYMRWLDKKGVIVVTTSSKKERIQEFMATFELPELTDEEERSIDEAAKNVHKRFYMRHMDE
ncbi:Aldo/keto reductase [Atractiella rhizophila]|nr:Aldo/keto reductase [Atractiella rhizophila]